MAHEEAARHYEMAVQALELREPRAEAERCELLLTLAEALWSAGQYDKAKQASLQAAQIARALGAAVQLGRAALAFGGRLPMFAAVARDETLVGLLDEALGMLGEEDSALRASMLARLAEEIALSDPYVRRESLCRQATDMARRVGDPAVLSSVLTRTHSALWVPENIQERLALVSEVVELGERAGDRTAVLGARWLRLFDLLELGDVSGAKREFDVCSHLAEELKQPYHLWAAAHVRVVLAFADGRLTEVETLAQRALQSGQEAQNENAALTFGFHMALLHREQGRFEEVESLLKSGMDAYPTIRTNLRYALALSHCDLGRESEARSEFERLAAHNFSDVARNNAWLFSVAYLSEICAFLGDAERAKRLYDSLLPFADRNVSTSPALIFGSASRYLGLLARTLGNRQQAARHFEDALEMNEGMGMRQAVVRTQVDYADFLLARGEAGDRTKALDLANHALAAARELGMKPMVEKALALKLKAQGIASGDLETSIDAVAAAVVRERPDLRQHTAPDGTVTILFTDIEGFTATTERLGDRGAQELIHEHNRIVREQIRAHGGAEVKSQGDGFMVAFQSARRGLRCAVAVQRAFAAHAERHPERPIKVRIGVNTGEAIRESGDFFGRAVILAARIADQAGGGEILASSLAKQLSDGDPELQFGDAQQLALKGLAGTHPLHSVIWSDAA